MTNAMALTREDLIAAEVANALPQYADLLEEIGDRPSAEGIGDFIGNGESPLARAWAAENGEDYNGLVEEIIREASRALGL